MNENDIHSLAPLYVVGALEADETHDFKTHLATCSACRQELIELRELTASLSSATAAAPGAALKASIMAEIAQTPQEVVVAPSNGIASVTHLGAVPPETADGPDGDADRSHDDPTVVPLRRERPNRLPHLVAAAAVLVALGVGGWAITSHQSAQHAVAQNQQLTQLLSAGDVKAMSGKAANGAQGTVVLSASLDRAVFVVAGLPQLPSGKVYELWTVTAQAKPAGTFTANGSPALVHMPVSALNANSVAVTVEPAGGSQHPTSTPVMQINLES